MKIEISEEKIEGLAEHMEKILKHGGKLMQCIEELKEGEMGMRYNDDDEDYGMRYGMRGGYGMRRGGRYGRY